MPDVPLTPQERSDAVAFIAMIEARSEASDAEMPHAVLVTDTITGYRTARGPYRDGYAATLGAEAIRAELASTLDDSRDVTSFMFDVVTFFTPGGDIPEFEE